MATLIIYASKYGTTEKCVQLLKEKLADQVALININQQDWVAFSEYDKVIIGSSVYMGRIHKKILKVCTSKIDELKHKEVGLFLCASGIDKSTDELMKSTYPIEILNVAKAKGLFGNELLLSKMSFVDKMITKKVTKIQKDTSDIDYEAIDQFVVLMKQ